MQLQPNHSLIFPFPHPSPSFSSQHTCSSYLPCRRGHTTSACSPWPSYLASSPPLASAMLMESCLILSSFEIPNYRGARLIVWINNLAVLKCHLPPLVLHATVMTELPVLLGKPVEIVCNEGFNVQTSLGQRSQNTRCQNDRGWAPYPQQCTSESIEIYFCSHPLLFLN